MKKVVLGVFAFVLLASFNNASESVGVKVLEIESTDLAPCRGAVSIYDSDGKFKGTVNFESGDRDFDDCVNKFRLFAESVERQYQDYDNYSFKRFMIFDGE